MNSNNGTLDAIYTLVGKGAVLLPLPFRKKGPDWLEWQRTTFEATQEPAYQLRIQTALNRRGNIGVLLGPPSENLAAIDLDDDALVEEFLELNPALKETLRSRGARGCQLWVRMVGDYPKKVLKLKRPDGTECGEWRGGEGQSVILGEHPDSTDEARIQYRRIVPKSPKPVAFTDINWPSTIVLPWKRKEPAAQLNPAQDLDKRITAYIAAIPGAVSGQGGHGQTFKVACYLVNGWGLSADEAMPYLQAYNQRCEPSWTDRELAHKLGDAEKAQHKEPRGHLRTADEKTVASEQPPRDPFGPKGGGDEGPAEREVTDEELSELDRAELERYHVKDRPFPEPMADDAFYGVAGDIVGIIQPASEASREAILAQLLVAIGNLIGRGPHRKQAGVHHLNEFTVLVGETATARKGTSWAAINNLLKSVNEDWLSNRMRDGFQSGESLIHAVRDAQYGIIPVNKRKAGQAEKAEKTMIDEGVSDKRLLIVEEEFARLLTVASRPGNTLSSTLRKAWDAKQWLHTEGKISPEKATGAHISMIGHVTIKELLDCLTEVENRNGFSNRVLWIATKRGQKLPLPPWIDWMQHPSILGRLAKVVEHLGALTSKREIHWSDEAEKDWCKFYKSIKTAADGIVGSIVARSDAHVLRLTMLFAVLDASSLMKPEHLKAAIAFWQYCERSASWIFGEKTGNKAADKIHWALQREPKGITRTQISQQVFNNHISKTNMDIALSTLVDAGLARFKFERVKGDKPIQRWFEGH